jgi:hypothetical protein
MKRNAAFISLFFILLIVALVLAAALEASQDEATPTPWLPPELTPDPGRPAQTPGWWDRMPTAIPISSPTPRN